MIGTVQYALPIEDVVQVLLPSEIIATPTTLREAVGLARFRDDLVPVVDLRLRFGTTARLSRSTRWLAARSSMHCALFVIDAITQVFGGTDEGLRPAPPSASQALGCEVLGVTEFSKASILVIDVQPLVMAASGLARPTLPPNSSSPRR